MQALAGYNIFYFRPIFHKIWSQNFHIVRPTSRTYSTGNHIFRRIGDVANQLQNIGTGLKSIAQSGGVNFTNVQLGNSIPA